MKKIYSRCLSVLLLCFVTVAALGGVDVVLTPFMVGQEINNIN